MEPLPISIKVEQGPEGTGHLVVGPWWLDPGGGDGPGGCLVVVVVID